MGEIWPKTCEGGELTKNQLVRAELVPGSHKTFRTEREKEAMLHYNGLGEGKKFGLTKESPL